MTLDFSSMRMPTLKIELIYMADGLFVYKTEDGYSVTNHQGYILKSAKTIQTCERFVEKELNQRRADEKINQDHIKNRAV